MFNVGYAQEIITPPVGVGLAGYFNKRPNEGAYDDLYCKVLAMECNGKRFALVTYDLCSIRPSLYETLQEALKAEFGELNDNIILSAIHTHTGPEFPKKETWDERTKIAADIIVSATIRGLKRGFLNLQPATLEATTVYNNPYAFVRRYFMKDGNIVTNPGWRNPNIDRPESELDRSIGILAVRQGGRIAALVCNIANHADTIGGNLVSADWPGRMALAIQNELKESIPVLTIDDASGDINHFDFRQDIKQTGYFEANRIGRGYARIILDALPNLQPLNFDEVTIKNTVVDIPHRILSPEEIAAAQHILDTVPDIKKEGDFESQDLANKVPAALRYFAKRALDGQKNSTPSHKARFTSFAFGKELVMVSLPGEPFNGIGRAVRAKSNYRFTFPIELAQSPTGYTPMKECFARGGYEVQPGTNTSAVNASDVIIDAAVSIL